MFLLRRCASLAALLCGIAACEGAPFDPSNIPKERSATFTALNGSGLIGLVQAWEYDKPSSSIIVELTFVGVGRTEPGARYPMHIHAGRTCEGVNAPIAHDLGAPASSVKAYNAATGTPTVNDFSAPVPPEHLLSGYYFDVHAPNDPTGAALGCALFEWAI